MTTGSQQLIDDYEQLQSSLELYPKIVILKTEGQPPDNYEIEYSLRGYIKEIDGGITIAEKHRVHISLPFGYPHFAPSVKPLTNTFHPDVDPAAFRIADKWQGNPSLPDLVLHIGEMLSGNIYNLEDPFNQEAADWYSQNESKLPLDSLSIVDIEPAEQAIDSLVDDTFASLGLEDDNFLEPEKEFAQEDVLIVKELIYQKKIFAANHALADIPEANSFLERTELQENINKLLKKAEQLFTLAEQLEDLGKIDEAVEVIDNLFDIAIDIPGTDSLSTRIKNAYSLVPSSTKKVTEQKEKNGKQKTTKPDKKKPLIKTPAFPKIQINIPAKPIFVIAIILALCLGGVSFYFKDQNILSHSQAELLKAQLLIDKQGFEEAQKSLHNAKDDLKTLTILRFKKSSLDNEIDSLLTSKELEEGLKGHILYQGNYISITQAASLRELETLTNQAQLLKNQGQSAEALTIYRQSFLFAQKNNLLKQAANLEHTVKTLELQHTLALAEQAELGKNWQEAAETYRQALELSSSLSDPRTASTITSRLTAATFRHELDLSKETFTQEQWQETIIKLEKAQQLIDTNPNIVSPKEKNDLHRLLVNARLYSTLSAARSATNLKDWDKAIIEYSNSLNLLNDEKDYFEGFLDESIWKIEKTLFMVKIAKMRENVLLADSKEDLPGSIKHSKDILEFIQKSKFSDNPAVVTVENKLQKQIIEKEAKIILDSRISWLKEHFEEIFRTNYPTFRGSRLVKPDAALLRKVDSKSIFIITCIEKSQGTSSRLELNYMYDELTKKWSIYTGE